MTRKTHVEPDGKRELFSPGTLGRYSLPSRIVMAPMTRNRAGRDGVPTPMMLTYYCQRASAALIITEATQISPQGVGYPFTPGIHTEQQAAAWRAIVDAVHRLNGRIFLQLFHSGRVSHPTLQPAGALPVSPSAIAPTGEAMTYEGLQPFVVPRALERSEIGMIVREFAMAADHARAAGFDGVEIHAANGYLLDQFLRDGSNHRTDEYGGSIANRLRLLKEVTEAVVAVWGSDRVGVRLSPLNAFNSMQDSNPEATFCSAALSLNRFALAYLHLVEEDRSLAAGPRFDLSILRSAWRGVLMVNGDYNAKRAEAAVASSRADFVSFGRLFIANPDLPERLKNGAPLNQPDRASFYGGDERGYIDYAPILKFAPKRTGPSRLEPVQTRKKVNKNCEWQEDSNEILYGHTRQSKGQFSSATIDSTTIRRPVRCTRKSRARVSGRWACGPRELSRR